MYKILILKTLGGVIISLLRVETLELSELTQFFLRSQG
jgi:hypothetical protein